MFKVSQRISKESDRVRQIMLLFKSHLGAENSGGKQRLITKEEFRRAIGLIGTHPSPQQSDELFDMYDRDGTGKITVVDFLSALRPADYQGDRWNHIPEDLHKVSRGRKHFLRMALNGAPNKPQTPNLQVYQMDVEMLCKDIRRKIVVNRKDVNNNHIVSLLTVLINFFFVLSVQSLLVPPVLVLVFVVIY